MTDIVFDTAKNGMRSCTAGGIRLHSLYDPQKEADRFVSAINSDFNPAAVIVTEPALSYCARPLKKLFPDAEIGAIRFCPDFSATDDTWDFVIAPEQTAQSLLSVLGETGLAAALFLSWQPSERAFPGEYRHVWDEIRKAVKTAKDILGTRTYFAERWIKNTCRFCFSATATAAITKGNTPILIAASGPSLKSSLPYIKRYRKTFFLMAVSSAYEPLTEAGIQPDVCISTDGGWWAKKHIERCSVPVITSAESAIPQRIFEECIIIPLRYGDGPESELLDICGFTALPAKRNGTVSGTAAELAFTLTTGNVFACGLDLAACKGMQHVKQNALETGSSCRDYRLKPAQTRCYPSEFESGALAVYRNWFSAQQGDFRTRFFRLADTPHTYVNMLGSIRTIQWDNFISMIRENTPDQIKPRIRTIQNLPGTSQRYAIIQSFFSDNKNAENSEIWLSSVVPAEYVLYKRSKDMIHTKDLLKQKLYAFMQDIREYINRWR